MYSSFVRGLLCVMHGRMSFYAGVIILFIFKLNKRHSCRGNSYAARQSVRAALDYSSALLCFVSFGFEFVILYTCIL